ncbi:MAG: cupin domain-containing protein [Deltaproteobacteria bacterium]|nr:MAG: cupin domain-containing protein [Deltaproteobacteria bacterium]TMQ25730.1 MAG: cupin domain-containing protein [Deltaproteobacteria bacterium]
MLETPPRFSVSHANRSAFHRDGLRPFYEYRDLGIEAVTSGRFHAHVIRPNPDNPGQAGRHRHALEFQIVYVLKGWVVFDYEGVGHTRLEAGDCVHQPSGIVHAEIEHSDDLEMLEITSPARFQTEAVEPG